jgi:DNA-directed RNA polymerase subunit alpha
MKDSLLSSIQDKIILKYKKAMVDLTKFTIRKVSESQDEGVFNIGPLPRGYGYTIANPLRRILISSLTGGAITSISISGVEHEYTSLSGLEDDILNVVINLKGVAAKVYSDEPVRATIKVKSNKGENKAVTAGDIQVDEGKVEIVNKDYVLTYVNDGATFEAEVVFEKGAGFNAADQSARSEIGMIPVDAVYSPVKNVSIKILNTRVGQQTDLDEVQMTIKTNGVLTPEEALREATQILEEISDRMMQLAAGEMTEKEVVEDAASEVLEDEDAVRIPVKSLNLSTRLRNALLNSAINDLASLEGKTLEELQEIKGMGVKSAEELVDVMKQHSLEVSA